MVVLPFRRQELLANNASVPDGAVMFGTSRNELTSEPGGSIGEVVVQENSGWLRPTR